MTKKTHSLPIVVALGLILTTGCGWLRPGGPPDEVHVEITSEDVSQLTLVISQNFVRFQEPVCAGEPDCPVFVRVVSADTTVVSPPYTNTIKFTERHQIYIETHPLDEVEARVSMTIDIDGKEWYDDLRLLSPMNEDGERDTLRFVYQYGIQQTDDATRGGGP